MIEFLISRFFSKEKALEMLEEQEDQITALSEKNPQLAYAVKTGFKLWSFWKILLIVWWSIIVLLCLAGAALAYYLVTKFL